ncbi:N-acetylglucosamine kinase [Deinococcus planocerae]|uniref:N-acetylglucosamine kinase n=1 Tax=Deinococcus planocerae TaxID=1737569 RepID=UPI000C7F6F90|nr:BadF/BadG/BcrA/BcrD ATPase family protein [Deinococcus planocerae]
MILSIDMGASGTKWALYGAEGTALAGGRLRPLTGHLASPEARRAMVAGLADLRAALPTGPSAVVAGVTGLQTEYQPWLGQELGTLFRLPPERLLVTDDLHLAYAAHFAPGAGTLVYAGTGAVAYHRTEGGEVVRAGGYGYLIDDLGGAFWQGQVGLRRVLRQREAGQPETRLARHVFGALGTREWGDIRSLIYGEGRAAVARLAPAVYEAARQEDPDALAIQRRAGQELARLAEVVLGRTGRPTLATAGGAFNSLVREAFHAGFAPGTVTVVPSVPPVSGGFTLGLPLLAPRP